MKNFMVIDKKLKYVEGVGRRKTSVARVRLYEDSKIGIINGKDAVDYFSIKDGLEMALAPLTHVGLNKKLGYSISVNGGGTSGQIGAIKLGVARALVLYDPKLTHELRDSGYLTRDPRMVERKKYYLKKARKAPQYSKR